MMRVIRNMAAFIIGLCVGGLLVIASARADNPHHKHPYIPIEPAPSISITNTYLSAIGLTDHHFRFDTKSPQWSVSAATLNGNEAYSISFGQILCLQGCGRTLITVRASHENDQTGIGVSLNGSF